MSEPNQFVASADHELANTGVTPNASGVTSFRSVPSTSQTPVVAPSPPMLPQRPDMSNMAMQAYGGMNQGYGYGGMGYGMGGMGMGSYGGLGGYGGYGGGYGMGGMGGMGMGMNPYGYNNRPYGDVESRFIQLAEENSRPAFDSIQSLVTAVGSVAMMLENTFFALTSSFRAILGVAENFGRLRSLFAQFWSALGVVRALNWLIRRLLVLIGVRTEAEFKAWSEAVAATRAPPAGSRASGWPVVLFFGVVAAAPYIILRMMSSMTSAIHDRLNDPTTWQNPLRAVAEHDFQATTPQEISFNANQVLTLAPQHLQGNLWNSGWVMASTDRQTAGLVPVNYIKVVKPSESEKQNVTEKEPERQEL